MIPTDWRQSPNNDAQLMGTLTTRTPAPTQLMATNFPVTLDDIKNLYYGITNPDHWSNTLSQLQQARNAISNTTQKIVPTGGSPISGPPMTFNDIWKRLQSVTNTPGKGVTQPVNQSGY